MKRELSEEEKTTYAKERKLNKTSTKLQEQMQMLTSQAKWVEFLNRYFGLVEVDIKIPEDKYGYFGEMAPIFKNIEYSEAEGGEYMKKIILDKRDKLTM